MKENNLKQNRTKIVGFVLALLLVTYVAPLTVAHAGTDASPDTGKAPYYPGLPANAVQYNKTDVTPVAQMEQVKAGEPALFQYRNMTMLMNCTRNCSLEVTADPAVSPKIFGFSVEPNQTMTLTMNLSSSPLEGAQTMERTLNFYLGIEPNATLELKAQLLLHINQTELSQQLGREVNASRLTWMYWNQTGGKWETVESYIDEEGFLVCDTDHFSTWTVAEMEPEEVMEIALNMAFVYAAISVVIVVILTVSIVVLKKHS